MRNKGRIIYADLLRVFAIINIIMLHLGKPYLDYNPTYNFNFIIGSFIEATTRFGVAIFVMMSGMLLVSESGNIQISSFFKRRFIKIFIPFLSWSFIYFLWIKRDDLTSISFKSFLALFFQQPLYYHLWFVYLIIAIYLLVPMLKSYFDSASTKNLQYFIFIAFLSSSIPFFFRTFFSLDVQSFFIINAFVGYFILGAYLHKYVVCSTKTSLIIWIVGLLITFVSNYWHSESIKGFHGYFFDPYAPSVLIMSIGTFLTFKSIHWDELIIKNSRIYNIVLLLSSLSYGIYLLHALVLELFISGKLNFTITANSLLGNSVSPIIGMPLTTLVIFLICFLVIYILRKLPVVKYIFT